MKKIFSWIVAALFVLSTFTVALAENESVSGANETSVNETIEEVNETTSVNETEADVDENGVTTEITTETNETEDAILDEEEEPSITPDKPILWGLKRAIENIDLAFTFNKAAKAKKGLKHAKERLLEVEAMITANKLKAAEKAQNARQKLLIKVQSNLDEMQGNPEEEASDVLDMEQEIEDQTTRAEKFKLRLTSALNLTEEQQAKLDEIIGSIKKERVQFKEKIEIKKNKIKTRIKAMTEKTDEEIEELMNEKREQVIKIREQRKEKLVKKIKEKREKIKERLQAKKGKIKEKIEIKRGDIKQKIEIKRDNMKEKMKERREKIREQLEEKEAKCEANEDCGEDETCVENKCEEVKEENTHIESNTNGSDKEE